MEILYAAEGSDWNWWYGDDHSSSNDAMFDLLFRQHLMAIYELLSLKIPDELYKAIKQKKHSQTETTATTPKALITPIIDGKITNFFEWKKAGLYKVGHSGGSMHQVSTILKSFMYCFDLENLYLNFSVNFNNHSKEIEDLNFHINFIQPKKQKVDFSFDIENKVIEFAIYSDNSKTDIPIENIAKDDIIEVAIPLKLLNLPQDYKNIEFTISIDKDNMEIERWPYQSSIIIPKPALDFNMISWTV